MDTVRWNVAVSAETDQALRVLLASRGGGRKGDLSHFIEEAVRIRVFDETVRAVRAQNADTAPEDIEQAVEEALGWAKAA